MSLYLGAIAVAVCDRCHMKVPHSKLEPDDDTPGLRVCSSCSDQLDPWKLPARRAETLTLRYPRPDTPVRTGAVASAYVFANNAIASLAIAGLAVAGVGYE